MAPQYTLSSLHIAKWDFLVQYPQQSTPPDIFSDFVNQGKDINKAWPISCCTVRDQGESSYAEEPRRSYCCNSLIPSKQFVREEKNERELKVPVEQALCIPTARTWSVSGGQDPPSDEAEKAELFPKVTSAGDFRPTKGQSPGLKKIHRRKHPSLLWNRNSQKAACLFSHHSNNGTLLLLRMCLFQHLIVDYGTI